MGETYAVTRLRGSEDAAWYRSWMCRFDGIAREMFCAGEVRGVVWYGDGDGDGDGADSGPAGGIRYGTLFSCTALLHCSLVLYCTAPSYCTALYRADNILLIRHLHLHLRLRSVSFFARYPLPTYLQLRSDLTRATARSTR